MKVSLIVPVYNVEKYLHGFMRSVIAQNYRDFEVILIDDCSTDESGQICDTYARENPFCRVFHHEVNQGVSAARNTGLDHARGEWIAFADPDDELHPDFLKDMIMTMEKTDCDMVICNFETYYVENEKLIKTEVRYPDIAQEHSQVLTVLCSLYPRILLFYCWNKLFRREIIMRHQVRFGSEVVWEDHLFVFEYCKYIDSIAVINDSLYRYRRFLKGRTAASTMVLETKLSYGIALTLLEAELQLALTREKRDDDPEQAEMLRQYVREHFLQNTYNTILKMSLTDLSLREQSANIKYISKDYRKQQRGHQIWKSGRRLNAIFHFLLMHRMNLMILLAINIRRRKIKREA